MKEKHSKKSKKSKKDKKKGKKHGKHDKPVRHEDFGDFEDHYSYDLDGGHDKKKQHSRRRHFQFGDEDEDHFGYNNDAKANGLRRRTYHRVAKPQVEFVEDLPHYYNDRHYVDEYIGHEELEWPEWNEQHSIDPWF